MARKLINAYMHSFRLLLEIGSSNTGYIVIDLGEDCFRLLLEIGSSNPKQPQLKTQPKKVSVSCWRLVLLTKSQKKYKQTHKRFRLLLEIGSSNTRTQLKQNRRLVSVSCWRLVLLTYKTMCKKSQGAVSVSCWRLVLLT